VLASENRLMPLTRRTTHDGSLPVRTAHRNGSKPRTWSTTVSPRVLAASKFRRSPRRRSDIRAKLSHGCD